jgi:2-polyprenyl-6-methoxyphenol hydroxylase-like FAD-dependent oxidoreductase
LIVGGGIAALTLAIALEQQGFRPELVERSPTWRPVGAGVAARPNGIRILLALGLGAAIEQIGVLPRRWTFVTSRGQRSANPTSRSCGERRASSSASGAGACSTRYAQELSAHRADSAPQSSP